MLGKHCQKISRAHKLILYRRGSLLGVADQGDKAWGMGMTWHDFFLCAISSASRQEPSDEGSEHGLWVSHSSSCQKTYPPPARLTIVGLACNLVNNLRRKLVRSFYQNFDSRGAARSIATTASRSTEPTYGCKQA